MKQSLTLFGLATLLLLTAACGATPGFSTVDVSSEGKINAVSSTTQPAVPAVPSPTSTTQPHPEATPSQVLRYNFVAGSQVDCENSIYNRFGIHMSCSIGGGCSLDGQFPSPSNPSANPPHWGACFDR